jgi:hypothetical protein
MFQAPSTPPPDITEPSVSLENGTLDEDEDLPYEVSKELRELTPVSFFWCLLRSSLN